MDASATPTATPPLVSLRNVGKRFANGTLALQGMTLDCGEHDFISFLGPSGCGKSTALRLIAGLTRASSGELNWSRENTSGSKSDRELGFVFQEPTLMPWAKVFDNVWLPLKLAGMGRDAAAPVVEQVLEMVGLSRFADVYPRELSGGMKMRVSIARALVTHPRLLLMDEPFAALDEMTRIKLNNDLLAIWREHRFSVIFVTHSVYESVYLSNRIVVMAARPGRVIDEIRIDEPYPRGEAFRTSSRYNAHCTAVSQSLHGALHGIDIDH
ncbi:ABC transporter ATP-binding protein [Variovorax sp. UMC13]|uniref:ABC transporter ATP-binding protein n=1 Tax=Variovorax sp. UMC13 TaxID=1862326 RepID=UPI0015FFE8BE|nr:ABC transporter ATP-binding protein [Variovorax sp. UMC13]MBB1604353.1 nitrate/sulfonate/bicarbonate ABC transporter ATP-binding protein [Variovorax sp. UMC13]